MMTIRAALEAILIAADEPIDADEVAKVLSRYDIFPDYAGLSEHDATVFIEDTLEALSREYHEQKRGFELHHSMRGWQLMSSQEYEQIVSSFVVDGQTTKLSQAALETLAIIAYKQPITRAEVAAIRGVNSDGVIRSLTVRGLIRDQGTDMHTHASLLVTSGLFLDKLGINDVSELPSLAPFLPDTLPELDD
ncbi:SMC-Scp complex subunit ScpB [Alloscardovia venturai]|uniref:SMC-Scp complex subunit ScpB n=1 Tax=Alloscardovia venturai TaxID=1769421 RepID=A0ABW2Y4C3_9BIFI